MSLHPLSVKLPDGFANIVRLFPLPNFVMFPGVVQPLRVFEPRYCEMLRDALAGDQLIAMALLQPGWEADYEARPPINEVVCIGSVVAHSPQDDGSHNILLRGIRRARISRELTAESAFRQAEITVIDDYFDPHGAQRRPGLIAELNACFCRYAAAKGISPALLEDLHNDEIPLGMLTDVIAFATSIDPMFNQFLLTETNVDCRARLLIQRMSEELSLSSATTQAFPPEFSLN